MLSRLKFSIHSPTTRLSSVSQATGAEKLFWDAVLRTGNLGGLSERGHSQGRRIMPECEVSYEMKRGALEFHGTAA